MQAHYLHIVHYDDNTGLAPRVTRRGLPGLPVGLTVPATKITRLISKDNLFLQLSLDVECACSSRNMRNNAFKD